MSTDKHGDALAWALSGLLCETCTRGPELPWSLVALGIIINKVRGATE